MSEIEKFGCLPDFLCLYGNVLGGSPHGREELLAAGLFTQEGVMETRVALIGIMVENPEAVGRMNALLHEYSRWIIGRMGLPYREKRISIISIVMDAPMDKISALSGKLGMLSGVSTKTIYAKQSQKEEET